jgi:hypothetical protein
VIKKVPLFAIVLCGSALHAQPSACKLQQDSVFMTSWTGQPGQPDHTEVRSLAKGTHLACLAFAAPGSDVPPACFVSLQNDGSYTLPPHNAMRMPKDDVVTLTCNGKSPTCCKMQTTPDPKDVPASEVKPHHESKGDTPKN